MNFTAELTVEDQTRLEISADENGLNLGLDHEDYSRPADIDLTFNDVCELIRFLEMAKLIMKCL